MSHEFISTPYGTSINEIAKFVEGEFKNITQKIASLSLN